VKPVRASCLERAGALPGLCLTNLDRGWNSGPQLYVLSPEFGRMQTKFWKPVCLIAPTTFFLRALCGCSQRPQRFKALKGHRQLENLKSRRSLRTAAECAEKSKYMGIFGPLKLRRCLKRGHFGLFLFRRQELLFNRSDDHIIRIQGSLHEPSGIFVLKWRFINGSTT
jgi:hypothetical protein